MITAQIIKQSLEDLRSITKVDFFVYDEGGKLVAFAGDAPADLGENVELFVNSPADSQEVQGYHFFKIMDEDTLLYILIARGSGEDVHVMGKVAAAQIRALNTAYKDKYDKGSFIQNLLLDNMLAVDIYNRAKKLHVNTEAKRLVYVIETKTMDDDTAIEILKGMFSGSGRDFITQVDEKSIILVKETEDDRDYTNAFSTARTICDMLNTEAMMDVRVAFGTEADDIMQISRAYKEARMALNVGKIFYTEKRVHAYSSLGIGRLIYQLPQNLCTMFINEVFTRDTPDMFDEETIITINTFFENNLNISETARQLFVHRNTLVYRLEKLERSTGLDIRKFDDALTFKIALMVTSYMRFLEKNA